MEGDEVGEKWTEERMKREEKGRNKKVSFWIITGGMSAAGTEEAMDGCVCVCVCVCETL